MTFEQLCESMGWIEKPIPCGAGLVSSIPRWVDSKGSVMAVNSNLTAAGAIAVQTEYHLETRAGWAGSCSCRSAARGIIADGAPDIPTAIRDCAMEIKNAPDDES